MEKCKGRDGNLSCGRRALCVPS